MLQSMRQLAHSWVFKGLMMLLVVSFGIWGIGDMFRGNTLHNSVAKAGAVNITVQEVTHTFEQNLARARQMFAPDMTAQQAKQMGMVEGAMNDLIESSLFDQDLQRLGIEADDRAVFALLVNDPQFKDKDGKFDKKILQNMLAGARINEREFLNQQRKELANRQLIGAFTALPPASPVVVDALYKARGQKRIFDIATVDSANENGTSTPDDKTLRDFYQANPKPFTAAEIRGITIATLSTDAIAKDINISDEQVQKEYDTKGDQLKEPEKRDLLQVILQDEDKAKAVAAAAKASGNLVSAAKPTGREVIPLNGTDESGLPTEISKPVFALQQAGVTDPIKTALGWHVIQVRKIIPAGMPKFDAIKESLRQKMKDDQASDTASRLVNQLDDELGAGHGLEDMAAAMKLRLVKIPALTAAGKTPDGKDPAELPHKEDVLKSAFSQNNGESSPVMDDRNGNYFVVRTDDVTPSRVKPFEQVKSDVIVAWKKQEQAKRAEADAETVAKSLREGKSAAAVKGVEMRSSKPISMLGDNDPSLPKTALPQMMKLRKGEVTIIPDSGKYLVVRLASVTEAPSTKDESTDGKITNEVNGNASKELADQYIKYLRVIFPVTIHQGALDSIAQQGN